MIDRLKNLFGHSLVYAIGTMLRRAFSLVTMPIFTRYLSAGGYGIFALASSIDGILRLIYGMGFTSSSTRYYYDFEQEDERKEYFGSILIFMLDVGFIISLTLTFLGEPLFRHILKDISFYPYVLIVIWTAFFSTAAFLPLGLLRIREQSIRFIIVILSQIILSVGLSVLFVVQFEMGPLGPLLGALIVSAIYFVGYNWYMRNHASLRFSKRAISKSLSFGLPVILLNLGFWVLDAADRFILGSLTTLSIVGIYSVGYAVGKFLQMFAQSLNRAWTPFFYSIAKEESGAEAPKIFSYVANYFTAVVLFLGLGVVVFRKEVIEILAPASYGQAVQIIPLVVMGSIGRALFYIPSRGLYLQKKTHYFPIIVGLAALVNIGLNFAWIPGMGMMGAAWATLVAYAVMILITQIISQRFYYIPYDYVRILKTFVAAFVLAWLSELVSLDHIIGRLILRFAILALFPVVLYLLGFFEAHELEAVKTRFRSLMNRAAGIRGRVAG